MRRRKEWMKKKKDEPTMGYVMSLFELSRMLDEYQKKTEQKAPRNNEEE